MIMKKITLLTCMLVWAFTANAQFSATTYGGLGLNFLEGTWIYQSNDTVFKVFLQKTYVDSESFKQRGGNNHLWGSYFLSVKGKVLDDYSGNLPKSFTIRRKTIYPDNLCIDGSNIYHGDSLSPPPYIYFTFYDKRKRHFDGKGTSVGYMEPLSPDSLLWQLDEKRGIHLATYEWDEDIMGPCPSKIPIGFSVPDNVILIREK